MFVQDNENNLAQPGAKLRNLLNTHQIKWCGTNVVVVHVDRCLPWEINWESIVTQPLALPMDLYIFLLKMIFADKAGCGWSKVENSSDMICHCEVQCRWTEVTIVATKATLAECSRHFNSLGKNINDFSA